MKHKVKTGGSKKRKRDYKNGARKNLLPDAKYQSGYLNRLDFRMEIYGNLAKSYAQLLCDLGGIENLSRIEQSLCERFVHCEWLIREVENEIIRSGRNGNSKELREQWIHYNNSLNSIAAKLGTVIRKPKGSKLKKHLEEQYAD